jgi:hypothetical protein
MQKRHSTQEGPAVEEYQFFISNDEAVELKK